MRARFALKFVGITCIVREIDLKAKAEEFLRLSPKGTVPVLVLDDGVIIDESIHIVDWALCKQGGFVLSHEMNRRGEEIIATNDSAFVKIIHHYKYPERYPDEDFQQTKINLHHHLERLNHMVRAQQFLLGNELTKVDIAVFPFVRQAVQIAPADFRIPSLNRLMSWLDFFLQHPIFEQIMAKHPTWHLGDSDILL